MISEPVSPSHGLSPGSDYLEFRDGKELLRVVDELSRDPDAFLDAQHRGRERAECFRASRVYPELLADAVAEIGAGRTSTARRPYAERAPAGSELAPAEGAHVGEEIPQ